MAWAQQKMSIDEFLAWENEQAERHELFRGEVFAMVGGRRTHGRVVLNLATQLNLQLRGTPCQVFSESMKIQVAADSILYPDLFVTCDKADLATDIIFRAPTLVIELLSPSAQAYDRSQKFALYRQLASLQEYILVDPDTRRVEGFRRSEDGLWVLHDMSQDALLQADSVGCKVAMAEVFQGMEPTEI